MRKFNLLYHCCEYKVDILNPADYKEKAIYLSSGSFISALGQFLYIFEYSELVNNFSIRSQSSGGIGQIMYIDDHRGLRFKSKRLGKEYIINQCIDVKKYALDVVENFNVLTGVVEEFMIDKVGQLLSSSR